MKESINNFRNIFGVWKDQQYTFGKEICTLWEHREANLSSTVPERVENYTKFSYRATPTSIQISCQKTCVRQTEH